MEAATPLNPTRIRLAGSLLLIDGLALTDEATVRVAHDRVEAGEGLTEVVTQAIEIGARVLDRESTSMHADFVKAEFERTARELEREFVDKARIVNETLGQRIDAAFGADAGVVPKLLEKHFGDASSSAVQHQVRGLVQ